VLLAVDGDRDRLESFTPWGAAFDGAEGDLDRHLDVVPERPNAGPGCVRVAVRHFLEVNAAEHRHPFA